MKLALLASTISAAAAFAPSAPRAASTTAVQAVPSYWDKDFTQEPGVTAPVSLVCMCNTR